MKEQPKPTERVNPAGSEWQPVEITARTPETADINLHHAHRGAACPACEIVALRAEIEGLAERIRSALTDDILGTISESAHQSSQNSRNLRSATTRRPGTSVLAGQLIIEDCAI